ncbi:Cytosine deaminase and related metal-dependent Hydrolase [Hahella chejuensis KCTC 2396]|uniref:5-methylthioadenosine/S-adenosylhomocysteine deaminase n=1 Tax=Hahella chejuensis (strain KCTC 2396) TaxID=349521 RepID=Q2SE62_HAHCH|nr:TRZ/ATZ family hydrolase [Hahella chejuensis]ABC31062.1 Cytosine deaminase and related metal-dependent Hydrolase [Hahella chejuensis KCTC 2396]
MAQESVDLLINARWVIPVRPAGVVLENASVAVSEGKIVGVCEAAEAKARYVAKETVDLPNHVVAPGLINTHGHLAMSLFRGMADDLPLMEWLSHHIWPAEGKWVSDEFVRDGSKLAMAEMLLGGTTTFSDMYFYPDAVAEEATRLGMRCQIVFPVIDFPVPGAATAEESIHKGLALHDEYKHSDLVRIGFGPHAPYTVSDDKFEQVVTLANQLDMPVQVHLHETAGEVQEGLEKTGKRPTERLHELGLLTPNTQCVHMTQINERDLEILQETGAHVVHCPESNLKLASGFCPLDRLLKAGVNVALGTDGAASNNDLDMLGELQTAAMLAKAVAQDAAAVSAFQALEIATINGAKALGMESVTGSLEAGKWADIMAVDLSGIEVQPVYHVASHLAYSTKSSQVSHVWTSGVAQVKEQKLLNMDVRELRTKVDAWREKIANTAEAN